MRRVVILLLVLAGALAPSIGWAGQCPGYCATPKHCVSDPGGETGGCYYQGRLCLEYNCTPWQSTSQVEGDGDMECPNEKILRDVLARIPSPPDPAELVRTLELEAQQNPAVAELLETLRILTDEGEFYKGHGYEDSRRSKPKATVVATMANTALKAATD